MLLTFSDQFQTLLARATKECERECLTAYAYYPEGSRELKNLAVHFPGAFPWAGEFRAFIPFDLIHPLEIAKKPSKLKATRGRR